MAAPAALLTPHPLQGGVLLARGLAQLTFVTAVCCEARKAAAVHLPATAPSTSAEWHKLFTLPATEETEGVVAAVATFVAELDAVATRACAALTKKATTQSPFTFLNQTAEFDVNGLPYAAAHPLAVALSAALLKFDTPCAVAAALSAAVPPAAPVSSAVAASTTEDQPPPPPSPLQATVVSPSPFTASSEIDLLAGLEAASVALANVCPLSTLHHLSLQLAPSAMLASAYRGFRGITIDNPTGRFFIDLAEEWLLVMAACLDNAISVVPAASNLGGDASSAPSSAAIANRIACQLQLCAEIMRPLSKIRGSAERDGRGLAFTLLLASHIPQRLAAFVSAVAGAIHPVEACLHCALAGPTSTAASSTLVMHEWAPVLYWCLEFAGCILQAGDGVNPSARPMYEGDDAVAITLASTVTYKTQTLLFSHDCTSGATLIDTARADWSRWGGHSCLSPFQRTKALVWAPLAERQAWCDVIAATCKRALSRLASVEKGEGAASLCAPPLPRLVAIVRLFVDVAMGDTRAPGNDKNSKPNALSSANSMLHMLQRNGGLQVSECKA